MAHQNFLLEICVDSLESIRNAIKGGAHRLELCSALSEGGLTPNLGLAKLAKRLSPIPVFAMIRIRGGDFIYKSEEIDAMVDDVYTFKTIGIDGFVFGALTISNDLDINSCKRIVDAAHPLPVTFHRAFDDAIHPLQTLKTIRDIGFARILTSGQKKSAIDGFKLISELIAHLGDDIIIMPGAGITYSNITILIEKTRAKEFHSSAKKVNTISKNEEQEKVGSNNNMIVTDTKMVKLMLNALQNACK